MSTLPKRAFLAALMATLAILSVGCGGGNRGGWQNNEGWSNNNNGSQTLTCTSDDNRNHSCRANFRIARAKIDQQMSNAPCTQGRTWGYDNNRIWVDQGCRARFRVYAQGGGGNWNGNGGWNGGGNGNWNGGGGNNNATIIRCESDNGQWQKCKAGFQISRVELANRLSNSPCKNGRDWGNNDGSVWVSNGCRAEFRVYRR